MEVVAELSDMVQTILHVRARQACQDFHKQQELLTGAWLVHRICKVKPGLGQSVANWLDAVPLRLTGLHVRCSDRMLQAKALCMPLLPSCMYLSDMLLRSSSGQTMRASKNSGASLEAMLMRLSIQSLYVLMAEV